MNETVYPVEILDLKWGNPFKELTEDSEYDITYWPQRVCKRTSSLEGKQREKSTEVTMKSYVPASLGVQQKKKKKKSVLLQNKYP
jgi:hypothetical protein